jgi:hypothetical protein
MSASASGRSLRAATSNAKVSSQMHESWCAGRRGRRLQNFVADCHAFVADIDAWPRDDPLD